VLLYQKYYAWFQDEASLSDKEAELQKLQGLFQKLRDTDKADTEALAAAQRKFQAVSSGLLTDDGGGDSTLQDQLMGTYVLFWTLSSTIWTLCLCMHVSEKKVSTRKFYYTWSVGTPKTGWEDFVWRDASLILGLWGWRRWAGDREEWSCHLREAQKWL